MDELITVGEIIKAQGLKGEVKVKPITSDITRFNKLRAVQIDTVPFRITAVRISPPFVFLKFAGVDTREAAEGLRGKSVMIDRVHTLPLDDGEFFIADIKGCVLVADGERLGIVKDVLSHGAADVFEVTLDGGKSLMFPFLNCLNLCIDTQKKLITVAKEALDRVAVYEN